MLNFLFFSIQLLHTSSQETEGTILDNYQTPQLSDYEKLQQQKNLNSGQSSSASSQVDTSLSNSDASSSLFAALATKQTLYTQLLAVNKALRAEYSEIQSLLQDLQSKSENYQNYSESDLAAIKDKINTMDQFNRILATEGTPVVEKVEKIETGSLVGEKEQNGTVGNGVAEDKDEISLTTVFVIGVVLAVLLLMTGKNSLERVLDPTFKLPLFTFYENLAILLMLTALTALLYFQNPFSDIDFSEILQALAIFTLIYAVASILTLIISQGFVINWRKSESQLSDLEDSFKSGTFDHSAPVSPIIKHYFQKLLFTNSPYLGDIFNIKYFDFSEYLGKCMGQVIHEQFSMSLLGYILPLISILLYRLLLLYTYPYESYVLLSYPLVFTVILLIVLLKLQSVHKQLTPNLTAEVTQSYKLGDFSTLPQPRYLQGRIPSLSSAARFLMCFKVHPCKLTFGYMFTKVIPNRHDLLFWFDVYGPLIFKYIVQGSVLSLHLWFTLYLQLFIDGSKSNPCLYISPFIYSFNILFLIPNINQVFTLTTSIEMQKKHEIVQTVQIQQKIAKSFLVLKIYRQLKMIFRNLYVDDKYEELKEFQKTFTEEIFKIYNEEKMEIGRLEDVLGLAGCELEDDELRLFAKECKPDGEFQVGLEGFQKAVSVFLRSQKFAPRKVVSLLFGGYLEDKFGVGIRGAEIEQVREFFEDFRWHFTDDDIEEFLVNVAEVGVREMPGMVQDCLECSFK